MRPTIITHQLSLSQDLSTTGGSTRQAIVSLEETEQLLATSAYHEILLGGEKEKIGDFRIFQTAPIYDFD
jgi:hypothetical protein